MKHISELVDNVPAAHVGGVTDWGSDSGWSPSREDFVAYFRERGWPIWDDLRLDLVEGEEQTVLRCAINTAREFLSEIRDGARGLGLLLVASPVDGDMDKTGYGCGKTTLAKIIHYANGYAVWTTANRVESISINGYFYESRYLMGLFDGDGAASQGNMPSFGNLLVIDDVGREGALRWEKRDPEVQLAEKQDRYYSIVNHCYERGINIVMTSNLNSRALATFLGGATWSRLLQMVPPENRVNMSGIRDMRPLLVGQSARRENASMVNQMTRWVVSER